MFYDEIIFQDALYTCTTWENGSFDILIPPDSINFDRSKIKYFKSGSKSSVIFGKANEEVKHQLIGGEVKSFYHVDFYPIIKEAELLTADYIFFKVIDANSIAKKKAKQAAIMDFRKPELSKTLIGNSYFKKKILEALHIDSTLSYSLETPFVIDQNVGSIIHWKNNETIKIHEGTIKDIFFNNWIDLGLPDFSKASWEEIDKLRSSNAGIELRRMIQKIVDEITDNFYNISDPRDATNIIKNNFGKELIKELNAKAPTKKEIFLNIVLNILPLGIGTVGGGIKDLVNFALNKRSWVSLLNNQNDQ